jgi:hypothetical protein
VGSKYPKHIDVIESCCHTFFLPWMFEQNGLQSLKELKLKKDFNVFIDKIREKNT